MSDHILIGDLLLRTIVGINPEERRDRQDVVVNIVLHADTHPAEESDAIEDAVNYRTIAKRVIDLVENNQFYLVEKMAGEIAALCLTEPRVERVTVRVEKPGALRFARSVGVEIERHRGQQGAANRAFISLGSNIEAERHLPLAAQRLAARCRLLAASRVYETEPVGKSDQAHFLNAAVVVETSLGAAQLKDEVLRAIERELGRVRSGDRNAPRTIDLDISLFNRESLDLEGRHIPDPDILRFAHVAQPLADLAPHFRHPETGQTLLEIARSLPREGLSHRPDIVLWEAVE